MKIAALFGLTHSMSITDLVTINIRILIMYNKCHIEKELTKLIHINHQILL